MADSERGGHIRHLVLNNKYGMHARCAAKIVELAQSYEGQIFFSKDGQKVEGSSILALLTLNCPRGSEVEVEAVGQDAEALLEAATNLFTRNFDED